MKLQTQTPLTTHTVGPTTGKTKQNKKGLKASEEYLPLWPWNWLALLYYSVIPCFHLPSEVGGWDFPGCPVGSNPPSSEEDIGSVPGPGRLLMPCGNWAQAPQPLKPTLPRACPPQQEMPPQWEACVPQLESNPHLMQLEKDQAQQMKTQCSQK